MTTSRLASYVRALDEQDWDGLRRLLAPGFRALFVHDGRTFDAEAFVAFQRDYPGAWRVEVVEHLDGPERSVARCRVSDGTDTYGVATFATVTGAGLLADVVEVWTEAVPRDTRLTSPASAP